MAIKSKYLVAEPKDMKEEPKAKSVKVKASISEYRLFGRWLILHKVSYPMDMEVEK